MSDKGDLRRHYRELVAGQPAAVAATASERVGRLLIDFLIPNPDYQIPAGLAPCFGAYQALPGEPDLTETYKKLEARGFRIAFPKVEGETLRFYFVNGAHWVAAARWGLREPDPKTAEEIAIGALDGALVPGLAFDRRGTRLGRGKGYYDRALSEFKGLKIGVAFSSQLADELPVDAHDVHMDWIVTETEVLRTMEEGIEE